MSKDFIQLIFQEVMESYHAKIIAIRFDRL